MAKKLLLAILFVCICWFLDGCNVIINPTSGLIVLQDSVEIPNGAGVFDFGDVDFGQNNIEIEFTLKNAGNSRLLLTGKPEIIKAVGEDADSFNINIGITKKELSHRETTTFTIMFDPLIIGKNTTTITIESNDDKNNPFKFVVQGIGKSADIVVKQNDQIIPSGSGEYDFGSIPVDDSSKPITFTIENNGKSDLQLTGTNGCIEIIGSTSAMFTVDETDIDSVVMHNSSTQFDIIFNPSIPGLISAAVSIANNDSNANPYTFTVTGTAEKIPEINIKQKSDDIPNKTGEYDFGSVPIEGSSQDIVFTIENLGHGVLKIIENTDLINISGTGKSSFVIQQSFTSNSLQGKSTTKFVITYVPKATGRNTATITIYNNDADENPYTFNVTGYTKGYVKGDFNGDGYSDIIIGAIENDAGGVFAGSAYIFFGGNSHPKTYDASTADVILIGEDKEDSFGIVSFVGDVNNDNYDDVIVGAPWDEKRGSYTGSAYIFFGESNPPPKIDANQADVKIVGNGEGDHFGCCVSSAGDLNNDNYDDFIIGAWGVSSQGNNTGAAYIYFGKNNILPTMSAEDADVVVNGDNIGDFFGWSVSSAGDFNGDDFDDVIIGARYDDDGGNGSGCAYILFGGNSISPTLNASQTNVQLIGEDHEDHFGWSVSNAGDFNGDGFDDVIVGSVYDNDGGDLSGCSFIFFGQKTPAKHIDASAANLKLVGSDAGNNFGYSVCSAGDFNNDGYNDVIVGAWLDDDGGFWSGCAFIFFGGSGKSGKFSASQADVKFIGAQDRDFFGNSVSSVGDFNNDGIDDVIIGALFADDGGNEAGCAYIFYGSETRVKSIPANNANVKIIGENPGDHLGWSVAGGK